MPALNEEQAVGLTIRSVRKAFAISSLPIEMEVVVVDGNSKDSTVVVARSENAKVLIQKNSGYGDAVYSGFLYGLQRLKSDILCTMDADGSYDATTLVSAVSEIIHDRFDLVICARTPEKGAMSQVNRLGNKVITALVRRILGVKVSDSQTGMIAFRTSLVNNITPKMRGWAFNTEILTRAVESDFRIGEVRGPYSRRVGDSNLSIMKGGLVNLAAILRMTRDSRPLFFHGLVSLFLMLAAFILGLKTIATGSNLLATLTAIVVLASGQILVFGLLADMIRDVRTMSMQRPTPYKEVE